MVKTRGGYHGEASSSRSEPSDERRRPTASARRRRVEEYRVDVIDEHDDEEQEELLQHRHSQDDYVEEEDIQQQHDYSQEEHEGEGEDEDEAEDGGFPGGPHDTSLLTHYTQHVAFAIWQGRERRGIKVVTHGKKLKHFGIVIEADEPHACVDGYITWFRRVSHPYITPGNDDERPSLAPRMRRYIPDERLVPPVRRRRSTELGLLGGMRRVIRMLQGMLTCRDVTEGTVAYQRTTETLQCILPLAVAVTQYISKSSNSTTTTPRILTTTQSNSIYSKQVK
ncbi:hypothetical protein LR48_Vigan04g225400 [Vigna angularis]|uniref:Uncharacterized protein n=1 Tax=Phaseolus angularis TaxID=3914 RepID=A0A0L9UHA2_PHAAN|nr:hypothetical protein LR48_Vigan04g225400 [Vigna angularis]